MKTVKAKNRLNNNNKKQAAITINPDFSQNLSNRILFFTSLVPALILMSFPSSFHFLAAKISPRFETVFSRANFRQ